MSTDPNLQDLMAKFLRSEATADTVPRPARAQDDRIEKTAAMRGTAREVLEAKPDNLQISSTPNPTTSDRSGGSSNE
jgi:hypothetical protein